MCQRVIPDRHPAAVGGQGRAQGLFLDQLRPRGGDGTPYVSVCAVRAGWDLSLQPIATPCGSYRSVLAKERQISFKYFACDCALALLHFHLSSTDRTDEANTMEVKCVTTSH